MKKLSTLLLAGLLLAGLSTGCKDKKHEEDAATQEQAANEAAAEKEADEEAIEEPEEAEEEGDADEDAPEIDEAMFIKAAYEVSCVKAKIDDPEEQKEILEVVYPRYGFETVEEYAVAETALKDSTSVKTALDEKMKDCTVEIAKAFKTAGAAEEAAEAEEEGDDKKPSKPKAAYKQGTFRGSLSGAGIESGKVNCTAFSGQLKCLISGKAEGKGFSIPATGKINSNGSYSAKGERSGNTASMSGQLRGSNGSGKVTLSVFKRDYTTNWN